MDSKKNILLSIHHKYAVSIINGKKTVELRRRFPIFDRIDNKKIFIYACSPISKIIGECDLIEVQQMPLEKLKDIAMKFADIDELAFDKYFYGRGFGFALYLENPIKYPIPIGIEKVLGQKDRPPQSYRYVLDQQL